MKDKKEKDFSQASQSKVMVRIYSRFGSDTRHQRATFVAQETNDEYGNPIVTNIDFKFDEDVGFKKSAVYSSLNNTLVLDGKNRENASDIIKKKIETLNKRIAAINRHPQLNVLANIWDEERELREIQIFQKYMDYRSPNGSYYKMEDGYRLYEYETIDGFLIPIWHGCDNLTDYQDYTVDRKITMQETAELKDFLSTKTKEVLKYGSMFMLMIVLAVLCGLFLFAVVKTLSYHDGAASKCEQPAQYCAENLAEISGAVTDLFSNDIVRACLMTQNKTASVEEVTAKIQHLQTDK